MLAKLDFKQIVNILGDDPVRPHLNGKFRCTSGREVYALYEDQFAEQAPVDHEGPLAVICVAYTNEVPLTEHELDYTVKQQVKMASTVTLQCFTLCGVTHEVPADRLYWMWPVISSAIQMLTAGLHCHL